MEAATASRNAAAALRIEASPTAPSNSGEKAGTKNYVSVLPASIIASSSASRTIKDYVMSIPSSIAYSAMKRPALGGIGNSDTASSTMPNHTRGPPIPVKSAVKKLTASKKKTKATTCSKCRSTKDKCDKHQLVCELCTKHDCACVWPEDEAIEAPNPPTEAGEGISSTGSPPVAPVAPGVSTAVLSLLPSKKAKGKACLMCRRRRAKCSGKPACESCKKHGFLCVWPEDEATGIANMPQEEKGKQTTSNGDFAMSPTTPATSAPLSEQSTNKTITTNSSPEVTSPIESARDASSSDGLSTVTSPLTISSALVVLDASSATSIRGSPTLTSRVIRPPSLPKNEFGRTPLPSTPIVSSLGCTGNRGGRRPSPLDDDKDEVRPAKRRKITTWMPLKTVTSPSRDPAFDDDDVDEERSTKRQSFRAWAPIEMVAIPNRSPLVYRNPMEVFKVRFVKPYTGVYDDSHGEGVYKGRKDLVVDQDESDDREKSLYLEESP